MDWSFIIEVTKQFGFPVALVFYLLYIQNTNLKDINSEINSLSEKIVALDAFIRAKLSGGN